MKKELFTGAATALITPMNGYNIDLRTFKSLCRYQIENGTKAIVVCGTTGEASTLSESEKLLLLAAAKEETNGKIKVIMGSGNNDTARTVEFSKRCSENGADALLLVAPYYNKGNDYGLYRHFIMSAEAGGIPVILYNVPSRTGYSLSAELYKSLSVHELVFGIKEASSDLLKTAEDILTVGDKISIYSGNDQLLLPSLMLGASGIISVAGNIIPKEIHDICQCSKSKMFEEAKLLWNKIKAFISVLSLDVNPIPIKTAMEISDICKADMRLPLSRPSAEIFDRIKTETEKLTEMK